MTHVKLRTVERLEEFVGASGRILGMVFLPDRAFTSDGLVDVSDRIRALFGVDPCETQSAYRAHTSIQVLTHEHAGGTSAFLQTYALARQLPLRLQQQLGVLGQPESSSFVIEPDGATSRYYVALPGGERQEITAEVAAERAEVAAALGHALRRLIEPDVIIDNSEIFYLHRIKDSRDLYFLVNSTFVEQSTEVALRGVVQPLLWDPSTGTESPITPWREDGGRTCFRVTLPPVGSTFIVTAPQATLRIVETNIRVEAVDGESVRGYSAASDAFAVIERDGQRQRFATALGPRPEPITLDGFWEFTTVDANTFVIGHFLANADVPGTLRDAYVASSADTDGWLPMVPGAWSYQLPAEPEVAYPIDVWYRAGFIVDDLPSHLDLIVDGFAGSGWALFVNGRTVTASPVPSHIDSQMSAVDITDLVQPGDNVVALRLAVNDATDGLLDLLKLTGAFSLAHRGDGGYSIAAPRRELIPAPWTAQGYPYYSGRGIYRRRISLPNGYAGRRIFLEPTMGDDVLEVVVNGRLAGVRLWAPYSVEITDYLHPGENTIELCVANTLVNLLEATERPSGLAGPPQLVAYTEVAWTSSSDRDVEASS